MPASWQIDVSVTGEALVEASSSLPVEISRAQQPDGSAETGAAPPAGDGETSPLDLALLPTQIEDTVSSRDVWSMAVLWIHGLASVGWILGLVIMVVALSSRPGVLAEPARNRLAAWYRERGAWAHWGLVPVIVATGVYNMLYVTPFPIAWKPSQLDALAQIPYGPLYEAILVVKLGLFAALVVTGTQVLLRTVRAPALVTSAALNRSVLKTLGGSLGPAGIVYIACLPLILGAAVALRYIHILSHVAEVVSNS